MKKVESGKRRKFPGDSIEKILLYHIMMECATIKFKFNKKIRLLLALRDGIE